ncbi:MAG: linear amide C-N hydrolase [Coriobacteriales bacterium]|nr:linear amide C-N hydrolase [Coriobacteriales bacterium]
MCTSFRLTAEDGNVVIGRSMEYALPANWDLVVAPRGAKGGSLGPDGPGICWKTRYGYAGIALGETTLFGATTPAQAGVTDGVNERGLYVGLLYLPGFTEYPSPDGHDTGRLLAPLDMGSYALATCATVAETIEAMRAASVWPQSIEPVGVIPLHMVVHDGTGASAVIEWVGGQMQVHEAPLGVATNAPPYEWHMTNLGNYVNLSVRDVEPISLEGETLAAIGAGSGWLGLPGDFTPPSRFVRAVALAGTAYPAKDSAEAARTALHILGSFDIPKGTIRTASPDGMVGSQAAAAGLGDFTSFVSVCELGETPSYGFRMYDDLTPKRVALAEDTIGAGKGMRRSLMRPAGFADVEVSM